MKGQVTAMRGAIVVLILILSGLALAYTLKSHSLVVIVDNVFNRFLRAGYDVALYENYVLGYRDDVFFEFESGHGRNDIADLRIQLPDKREHALRKILPDQIDQLFNEKSEFRIPDTGARIVRYSNGLDSMDFCNGKLDGIRLGANSEIAIDFGDGTFVKLPIRKDVLIELIGPPGQWRRVVSQLP